MRSARETQGILPVLLRTSVPVPPMLLLFCFALAVTPLPLQAQEQKAQGQPAQTASALESDLDRLVRIRGSHSDNIKKYGALGNFPVMTRADLEKAAQGELVIKGLDAKDSDQPRSLRAKVVKLPVEALYLVLMDFEGDPRWIGGVNHSILVEWGKGGLEPRVVQYASAPFPAKDRFWGLKYRINRELYAATGGKCWQMHWKRDQGTVSEFLGKLREAPESYEKQLDGLSLGDLEEASDLNATEGSWLLISLDNTSTYLEYRSLNDSNPNAIERAALSLLQERIENSVVAGLIREAKKINRSTRVPKKAVTPDGRPATVLLERF